MKRHNIRFDLDYELPEPLTAEQTKALASRLVAGDETVRSALIEGNLKYAVGAVYNLFDARGDECRALGLGDGRDLCAIAIAALVKAINRMTDPRNPHGCFSVWIGGALKRALDNAHREARLPLRKNYDAPDNNPTDRQIDELVDAVCATDDDRELLRLSHERYILDEAVKLTGRARSTIHDHLQRLKDAAKKYLANL